MVCEPRGVDRCELRAETLGTTRERRFVDPNPAPMPSTGSASPRTGSTSTDRGDVFVISPPAAP